MITINQLQKAYNHSKPVIDRLDLQLEPGASVSIRGASGSGKSTLLSLIAGFTAPDAGQIQIGPCTLPFASDKQGDDFRKNQLGVIFQSFNLLDCLSVWDNIAFTARLKGNHDSAYQQSLMKQLGIAHLADQSAASLSGGEQQRVAIARALVHRPALVLADEPTGNLDEHTSEQVADALYHVCLAHRTTLVVVTHSQDVALMAQRSLWLHHGRLVDDKVSPGV